MSADAFPAELDVRLCRLMGLWGQGEAAWRDPVLINCLSRETSALDRLRPGASAAARALFDQGRERPSGRPASSRLPAPDTD